MSDDTVSAGAEGITPAQVMADIEALPTLDDQVAALRLRVLTSKNTPLIHAVINSPEFENWLNKNMAAILEAASAP